MVIAARPSRSISLVLAALTLASGLLPPALGHSHPDGDRPHRHHDDHDHRHAGLVRDDAPHEDRAKHHRASTPAVGRPATAHLHIDLGAFGLTFPTPSGPPAGPGHPAPGDTAIRAADDEALAARIEAPRLAVPWPGSLAVVWVDGSPPLSSPSRSVASPGTSLSLCDAARHERSGVLLT